MSFDWVKVGVGVTWSHWNARKRTVTHYSGVVVGGSDGGKPRFSVRRDDTNQVVKIATVRLTKADGDRAKRICQLDGQTAKFLSVQETTNQKGIEVSIPEEFYKAGRHPKVYTVKQLKEEIASLPDDLAIGYAGEGVELVVPNVGTPEEHLHFREIDD